MIDWQPIETAIPYLRTLDRLIERKSNISTYGPIWVWSAKDGLCEANLVDWGDGHKQTHWRTTRLDYEGEAETIKPTHWFVLNLPEADN